MSKGSNMLHIAQVIRLINQGDNAWEKKTGLLSIWMLGMFNPSPSIIVIIPVKPGDDNIIGPKVNDTYFGKISR